MIKKYLIITGGTGGHVIPAVNFGNYLINKSSECIIMSDKRGYKYTNQFMGKIKTVSSSNLNGSLIIKILGLIKLIIGFVQSLFIILYFKPNTVISFGSYASFFPMISCLIIKPFYKIDIFIHEQNSILGRTNSLFLTFTKKFFINFDIRHKINDKFHKKIFVVGSPERQILNLSKQKDNKSIFTIFIYGGSQGSEFLSNFSIKLMKIIAQEKKINVNYIIQSPKKMIKKIIDSTVGISSSITVKDYFYNIEEVLENTSLAISRSGAGSINDLIKFEIPSILVPLPTAKDNHQYHNALIMKENEVALIINQNNYNLEFAKNYIYEIYNNKSKILSKKFEKIKVKNSNSLIYKLIINEQ